MAESDSIHAHSAIVDGRWEPTRSDNFEGDCSMGRALAVELNILVGRSANPRLRVGATRAIVEAGTFGGVEVGFFEELLL